MSIKTLAKDTVFEYRGSMLTENIAKDAAFLICDFMVHIITSSVKRKNNTEQFKRARNLWHCIKTEFERVEASRNIAIDLEVSPDCGIVQAIFRHQLSKRLKQDDDFAFDVEQILYVQEFRTPIKIQKNRVGVQSTRVKAQFQMEALQDEPQNVSINAV